METNRTDAELAAAWQRGDAAALGAVYDRHADALFGFALARTRSRADAADVVQDTFVRAATRIGQLREPERLRAWLFAIARRRVFDLSGAAGRRGVVTVSDDLTLAALAADTPAPDAVLVRDEVRELVWTAAESLNERDRELLELHLRQGLEGADLADVVGVSPAHVYSLVNRLKERMAKAVGALLVARHARRECPALDALLGGWDGRFTLDVRSRVTRHVEACATCADRRGALVTPATFTAGGFAVPLLIPAMLRDQVLQAVTAVAAPHAVTAANAPNASSAPHATAPGSASRADRSWRADGFPRVARSSRAGRFARRRSGAWAVGVAGALVLAGVATIGIARSGDDRRVETAPTASASADAATAPASSDGGSSPAAGAVDPTGTASPATVPATPIGGAPADSAAGGGITEKTAPGAPTARDADLPVAPVTSTAADGAPAGSSPPIVTPTGGGTTSPGGTPGGTPTGSTSPATTAPAPPAPTTTATATTAPAPATPPAALSLSTGSLDLGASTTTGSFSVTNTGGQAATLSTTTSSTSLAVSNGGASIAPGATVTIGITLDRSSVAEGERTFTVSVSAPGASGGGTVTVTARVERSPTIVSIVRTPTTVRTSTSCGQTLTRVTVEATDESGIGSVSVLWSSDGVFAQRTTLTVDTTGRFWTGQIGSFSATGTRTLTIDVSDNRGNDASGSTTVVVVAC